MTDKKAHAQAQRDYAQRMREAGFVHRCVWVHTSDLDLWSETRQTYLQRMAVRDPTPSSVTSNRD